MYASGICVKGVIKGGMNGSKGEFWVVGGAGLWWNNMLVE